MLTGGEGVDQLGLAAGDRFSADFSQTCEADPVELLSVYRAEGG